MTTTEAAGRVLVTGVNGFVGAHLVRELIASGFEVVGVGLGAPTAELSDSLADYVDYDLTTSWPDVPAVTHVVHLAALSAVGPSFDEPQRYLTTNSSMVVHLGEHQLAHSADVRTLVVSSGAVYDPARPLPISETGATAPSSPYVVSKLLVEDLAGYYARRGLDWIVARPFNHVGPGQGQGFLLPDLYAGCREAETTGGTLEVGDLTTRRDYSDVRDVVRAYRMLLQLETPGHRLYNVCSGRDASGEEVLAELRRHGVGVETSVVADPARMRPTDPRRIVGDPTRLQAETGWAPEIALTDSVRDFVAGARLDG